MSENLLNRILMLDAQLSALRSTVAATVAEAESRSRVNPSPEHDLYRGPFLAGLLASATVRVAEGHINAPAGAYSWSAATAPITAKYVALKITMAAGAVSAVAIECHAALTDLVSTPTVRRVLIAKLIPDATGTYVGCLQEQRGHITIEGIGIEATSTLYTASDSTLSGSYETLDFSTAENSDSSILEADATDNDIEAKVDGWYEIQLSGNLKVPHDGTTTTHSATIFARKNGAGILGESVTLESKMNVTASSSVTLTWAAHHEVTSSRAFPVQLQKNDKLTAMCWGTTGASVSNVRLTVRLLRKT